MLKRSVESLLKEALKIAPAVLLTGARQVGKSTLCLNLDREYRVFDNLTQREAAKYDPEGYIASLPKPVTIDEIQKVPEVLEGIKLYIDKDRKNGDFLLTGSANVLDMKKAKDTLAGRLIEITLFPLSQKELNKKADENIIDILFTKGIESLKIEQKPYKDILQAVVDGGYPEILKIKSQRGKKLWFDSYISTYIERDIRDVGELRDISAFIRFFNIMAPRSSKLINKSNLANEANLSEATVNNYLSMLEMIYQISLLKPYSSNISKRFIKTPKFYLNDSGLLCHILDINSANELIESKQKGDILETFVYTELQKHISYSQIRPDIYHYRTSDKKEIDFIIQKGETIFSIEVKSSQTIKRDLFKHIEDFQNRSDKKVIGIVLYGGEDIVSFGDSKHIRVGIPLSIFF
jgi:predicted AAA+ superfamily ATPase